MDISQPTHDIDKNLKCKNCGAALNFMPGTHSLTCDFCKTTNEIIPDDDSEILSYDLLEFIAQEKAPLNTLASTVVKCNSCGASTTLPANVTSTKCPFCTAPLVLDINNSQTVAQPHYVLPFKIDKQTAVNSFTLWIKGLWFAPSGLGKKMSMNSSALTGVYLPHWTFDADTQTSYQGKRGDYYYVTETYTETVDGEEQTREREVRHTDWNWVSGVVECSFDDILVEGSSSLSHKSEVALQPWDIGQLVHFDERYLSGFRSEAYQVKAEDGFNFAKKEMEPAIRNAIINDIGGDEQVIENYTSNYDNLGVKYILLPVWISSFMYNNKTYQFVVNANTAKVVGEYPKSWIKITLCVLAVLAIIVFIFLYFSQNQR